MKRYFVYAGVLATSFFGLVNADPFEKTQDDMSKRSHRREYNEYNLVIGVGQDEVTAESPLSYGPQVFAEILDYSPTQAEQLRQAAIVWFRDRFGIDFANAIPCELVPPVPPNPPLCESLPGSYWDPDTGAILFPLANEGTYRVLTSTSKKLPENSQVRLAEWVVSFAGVFPGTEWGGTYAAEAAEGDVVCGEGGAVVNVPTQLVIAPSDGLAFGVYRITPRCKRRSDDDYYFFMRSYFPNRSPAVNFGSTETPPLFVGSEYLQMYSNVFGPGFGFLNVAFRSLPGTGNMARAIWAYPGAFVVQPYNAWTSAPVQH